MTKRFHFETDGRYPYGFTTSGLFTLLNRKGESLYDEVIPLYEKLGSHLIWMFLWLLCIFVSRLFFASCQILDRVFMGLVALHLFLFGCRLTALLLKGGFSPIFFPPLWIRLTRQLQKGKGIGLLKRHQLAEHPGLLVNLALVQFSRNEGQEGRESLHLALRHSPDHPLIKGILYQFEEITS